MAQTSRAAFLTALRCGEYDKVDCIIRHLHVITGPFDAEIIDALPRSVRVIGNVGAGYDQIDVEACTRRGIYVTHTPDAVRDATAEAAVFLVLGCVRKFGAGSNKLLRNGWLDGIAPGRSLCALTVGILGLGSVGTAISERLAPFGCKVQYHNRKEVNGSRLKYIPTMDALLASSDVVIIAVPLNAQTRHLINCSALSKMKKGSWLINVARGPVVHEEALVGVLRSGHLAGAGLDVFEHEPTVHPMLLQLAKEQGITNDCQVVFLPHMGTHTTDAIKLMEETALKNTLNVYNGRMTVTLTPFRKC
ncbi:D-isomer specific 2-hydroxyacid dehydrogenase [Protomyces lactucae-debilis]|uniref:D-isomer specific 2-hydroxyacid dehydrogenase n=1 Tax=Protomyces lactucae-debilis TaxID=2754530 RepID=A0A1Y2FRS1_PROLT|nr:D-isomer specific 2-hydroxyacid dehydrogenase [Protomyces lactucae-debilis]ORY86287.1 D-isomer specific 2-hydroxyacid dehydrogenase [Protomyces lactucae-debilis]